MKKYIACMNGIGDVQWMKPVIAPLVKKLHAQGHEVYAAPSVPEMWEDIPNLRITPSLTKLRTQSNHVKKTKFKYKHKVPDDIIYYDKENWIVPTYGEKEIRQMRLSIVQGLEHTSGSTFDQNWMKIPDLIKHCSLSKFKKHDIDLAKDDIAIIRPVTIRKEWDGSLRAPEPSTVAWCARVLKKASYKVVSIADTDGKNEWIVGGEPDAHVKLHHGELTIPETIELMRAAKMVVGGSGFIVPISIALGVPLFTIFGGRGGYDSPFTLFDPRMDLRNIYWALPDNFCRCYHDGQSAKTHQCDKRITDLDSQFYRFIREMQQKEI